MTLFLNDVAGSEILLIFVFVLIFFGSKSIPNLAKTLGRTIHQIKSASNDIQEEIKKSGLDMKRDMNFSNILDDTSKEISNPITSELNQVEEIINQPAGSRVYGVQDPVKEMQQRIKEEEEAKAKVASENPINEINPNN
jgi:sec-independent protein translocase protein TatA